MQLDLRTLFIVLVILYACLGFVCLFLPYRMPGSHAVTNWGYGLLALAAGTGGSRCAALPRFHLGCPGQFTGLASFLFVLRGVAPARGQRSNVFGWSVVAVSALLLVYFTYTQPDTRIRIVIVSVAIAILVVRPVIALIAAVPG